MWRRTQRFGQCRCSPWSTFFSRTVNRRLNAAAVHIAKLSVITDDVILSADDTGAGARTAASGVVGALMALAAVSMTAWPAAVLCGRVACDRGSSHQVALECPRKQTRGACGQAGGVVEAHVQVGWK